MNQSTATKTPTKSKGNVEQILKMKMKNRQLLGLWRKKVKSAQNKVRKYRDITRKAHAKIIEIKQQHAV